MSSGFDSLSEPDHGRSAMYRLQETLVSATQRILEADEADIDEAQLEEHVSAILPDVIDELSADVLSTIKEDAFSGGLEEVRAEMLQFEDRLAEVWRKPLDLLELFVALAKEACWDFNREFGKDARCSGDDVFEALTRLHGRACQVSGETLVLLRSGFADGAHARWRTLHEISLVAALIYEHGPELAEKYLLHRTIQQFKLACQLQIHYERLGQEPVSEDVFSRLKEKRDMLMARFGSSFKEDYGWAADVTRPKSPKLSNIEECVDQEHWRPYYKMASGNVHPNSHELYFRLGLASHQRDVILAGPSNMGLADPGHATAISLNQTTAVLLATRSTADCRVFSIVLQKLVDEIGEAFLEVHQMVESMSRDGADSEC